MKVETKKIEKIALIIKQIQVLDIEISKIDRYALLVANNKTKATIKLTIDDLENNTSTNKSSMHGDHMSDSWAYFIDHFSRIESPPHSYYPFNKPSGLPQIMQFKSTNNNSITDELSENSTMQILGIILGEKQRKMAGLINELQAMGVKI